MNREQAVRLQKHLLDAHLALDDAGMAIAGLGKEERLRFDGLLWEVVAALRQKLLAPIHEQFPDIEPPVIDEEIPAISSELRWDQVRLPPSVTESGVDEIIFSTLEPRWQKTAMVIGLAVQRCKELDVPIGGEAIAARLQALADADRIEGIGDLRKWRHSEMRLKD
jgi:hypothetical protein